MSCLVCLDGDCDTQEKLKTATFYFNELLIYKGGDEINFLQKVCIQDMCKVITSYINPIGEF